MAHIALLTIPATGHVLPTLDLVAELTSRGHRVTYLAPAGWTSRAEQAGARAVTYRSTLTSRPTTIDRDAAELAAWLPFVLLNEEGRVVLSTAPRLVVGSLLSAGARWCVRRSARH